MVYPPRSGAISIPAVIAGNILQNDDTSISAIDSGFDGSLVMRTQNELALLIGPEQTVSINTEQQNSRLTINNDSSTTSTLRLSYQDSFYFDSRITSNGNVLMIPSCDDQNLDADLSISLRKNVDISDHNGSNRGLRLNGVLITATAPQLNYVNNPEGIASPSKALILNSSKNITGINQLSATTLTGTLTSGPQLGITDIDTLNIVTQLRLNGIPFALNPTALSYLDIDNIGVAQSSRALVVDANRDIVNIRRLTATTLTGTLAAGPQPNITSLSSLNTLNVAGLSTFGDKLTITSGSGQALRLGYDSTNYSNINIASNGELSINTTGGLVTIETGNNFRISSHNGTTSGLILGTQLVMATGTQINYIATTPGTAAASKALVLDSNKTILDITLLGATSIAGTLTTGNQPNIISVNRLDIANHNGNTTGLSLSGVLITATAVKINYIDTTPGSAQPSKALVTDSARSITNINALSASTIEGTIATGSQPNITSVNTLRIATHDGSSVGLMLGSVLVTATANQLNFVNTIAGIAGASKAMVLDTSRSINNINSLSANTLSGTLTTPSQVNINLVNTLNIQQHDNGSAGLSLGGVLVTASAVQINRINTTPGIADLNKAMVLNSSKSISGINTISAANLSGTLTTPSQTNIRLLQSVNVEDHNGTTTGLSLGGTLVTSTAAQLNALSVNFGTALPLKALVLNSSGEISGIATISSSNINGTIRTSSQPFILSTNTLNITAHDGGTLGLALGGTLVTVTADQINKLNVSDGNAAASRALVLNSNSSITGINFIAASTIAGTLTTGNQPNITSINNLNIALHNGTAGLSLGNTLVTASANQINRIDTTPGVGIVGKAVILDSNLNFTGVNNFGATTLAGTLTTPVQPNINRVTVLNISGHDGGSQGLQLGGSLVASTAVQLNYTSVIPGTATAVRALVTNDANSIAGINTLSATRLVANQLSLTGIISNFNTNGVVARTYSMTNLTGRIVDTQLLPTLTFQNFQPANMTNSFSTEIYGYILPQFSETYTFFVNCNDRIRMWVNDVLVLHSWTAITGFRSSSTIFLNADQWVKIYIQYQVDAVSSTLLNVQWSSTNTGRFNVPSDRLAWDSNQPANNMNHYTQNSMTIYNNSTSAANFTTMTVDTGGDLTIDASGNDIILGVTDNFNIPSHDGLSKGLVLGGVLVQPTAFEINYLKVNAGTVTASKALVVDASKSLFGLNSLTSNSISCTNLSAAAFTISNLTLPGPLNNYASGSLLIRQFTGPDVNGRVVNVSTITDINISNYDPLGLTSNYSLDIIGYVRPTLTESYTFYAIANDRVRIWVNNVLILNVWDTNTGLEYTSSTIQMTANQWTPIYIQYQNISDTSTLIVRWSSTTLTKSFIPVNAMAWDNSVTRVPKPLTLADSITLFSSQTGLTTVKTGSMNVDSSGNLSLATNSGNISIASGNDLNIVSHNGSRGLYLSGNLVSATAAELNRVSGVVPGTTAANKAIILDSGKAITGITSLTCDNLYSVLRIGAQPYITSFGTLNDTLLSNSDILLGPTTLFRFTTNSTTALISSSSTNTTDSAADLFIGNYGTTPSTSSRKFMVKASGAIGIQTNTPNRALSINGESASYAMRIINNNATGSETNFTDFGTNSSGQLVVEPSGSSTNLLSNLVLGKTSPATLAVSSGVLKITSTSGSIQIGNSSNSAIPLEVGSASFTLTGTTGYLNADGSTGTFTSTPSTYSMRTTSSIIVNGTVCVTSDRRLKENIVDLNIDKCRKFIMHSSPVSFAYKTDRFKTHFGLIAQDIAQSEFKELVQFTPDTIEASIENGFHSPRNASMNVSYTEIIPILMTTIKDLYAKNEELERKISELYRRTNGL